MAVEPISAAAGRRARRPSLSMAHGGRRQGARSSKLSRWLERRALRHNHMTTGSLHETVQARVGHAALKQPESDRFRHDGISRVSQAPAPGRTHAKRAVVIDEFPRLRVEVLRTAHWRTLHSPRLRIVARLVFRLMPTHDAGPRGRLALDSVGPFPSVAIALRRRFPVRHARGQKSGGRIRRSAHCEKGAATIRR